MSIDKKLKSFRIVQQPTREQMMLTPEQQRAIHNLFLWEKHSYENFMNSDFFERAQETSRRYREQKNYVCGCD